MIKLVATDIDGTILGQSRVFTDGVKNCIKKLEKNGIKVVLVTGRMNAAAQKVAKDLNLQTPLVSYQGGLIVDKDGTTLYEDLLPEYIVDKILDWAKANNVHINYYTGDKLYTESDNDFVKRYSDYQCIDYIVKRFDELPHDKVNKLLGIDFKNPNRVSSWVDEKTKEFPELHIVKSTPYFCEFSTKTATKYCAVKFLQKYWNIQDDEVLTIGDQDNDIELLKAGSISVAMGNASDNLKRLADYITDTVDNDGFVKAINKFVLKGE
jgi:hypothetical protein